MPTGTCSSSCLVVARWECTKVTTKWWVSSICISTEDKGQPFSGWKKGVEANRLLYLDFSKSY